MSSSIKFSFLPLPPATKQKSKAVLNQFNDEDDDDGQGSEQTHPNKSNSRNKKSNLMIPISSSKLSRPQKNCSRRSYSTGS
ncbi:hypothetical protein PSHT_07595 [Puccinia striiformis]|uniref:Uncharacterized protein n=1 Tax=Puccinia striiformis TaxID=27350 RepID=A0A2S4VWI3_9BASI|nr:hypothetical protein PSHT_07595 [Puccinia striiformis]